MFASFSFCIMETINNMEVIKMKEFIIRIFAAGFIFIVYFWLMFEMIFKYDNYLMVLSFPILVPITAWIFDWDL